ncbi:MAG: methylmalonyl-CoA epimerase [Myxococcota bacterium]|nr:methylmalonyl-CoA epimerase [Myxococcota bacterium]
MFKIKKIDHVAVCVGDVAPAAALWKRLLGLTPGDEEFVDSQMTDVVLVPIGDDPAAEGTTLELIAPRGSEGLQRFLEKRGPGLHHVALEVEGIEEAIAFLKGAGAAMIDETPRRGARGHKVAFIHPRSMGGVLVELVERERDR